MQTSQRGLDLIKLFEGLELEAYLDAVDIWTIGYGHTSRAGPPDVTPGMTITEAEAEEILRNDLRKFERDVSGAVRVDITQNMFDALVSLTYNIGPTNMRSSTFLRRLNSGDYEGAADAMLWWNKAGGQVLRGLQRRRAAERELFLDGYDPDDLAAEGEIRGLPVEEDTQRRENIMESRTIGGAAVGGTAGAAAVGAAVMGDEDPEADDQANTASDTGNEAPDTGGEEPAAEDQDAPEALEPPAESDASDEPEAAEDASDEGEEPKPEPESEPDPEADTDEGTEDEAEDTDEPTDVEPDEPASEEPADEPEPDAEDPVKDTADDPADSAEADAADEPDDATEPPAEELIEGTEEVHDDLFVSRFEGDEGYDAVVVGAGTVAVLSAIWVAAVRFDDWRNHRR